MKKLAIYYGTCGAVILIGALLVPQAVVLHPSSLLPAGCLLFLLFFTSKWYFTKGGRRRPDMDFKYVKIEGEKGYFQETENRRPTLFEWDERCIWLAARLFAPAFFPFVVFVSPWKKLWSLLLMLLFGVGVLFFEVIYWQREAKKAMAEKEKRMREQRAREELGKWK